MAPRKAPQKAYSVCGVRDDIPEEVRLELAQIGGLEGLCSRLPCKETLASVCQVHHALSDPVRMMILHLLLAQPLCVCVIKECVQMADSKLSYHLSILKECGLIEGRMEKHWIIYRLTDRGRRALKGDMPKWLIGFGEK